ncbi:DUF4189 domain-containing protein [Lysobacter sp. Hz 25]|uniref:DUF4189 domain-containing protein n=1 Tax=Lysobacter sp. Hz 25 TaxID=3383698 RepID=UPI0038D4B47D
MRYQFFFILVALSVAPFASHAEGGCPPGQMPGNLTAAEGAAASMASCVPIPQEPRRRKWESRWGAVATDEKGAFGIATDKKSEREAKKSALSECTSRGGMTCSSGLVFRNQCAAVVNSSTRSFSQSAATENEAVTAGQQRCKESSTGKCWVYFSGCSLPVRAR